MTSPEAHRREKMDSPDLVEKVARAIWNAPVGTARVPEPWVWHVEEARAAIKVIADWLREPDSAMLKAVDAPQIKAFEEYQNGIYTPWTEEVLRAIAAKLGE